MDTSKEAFIEAITKLADDEEFRKSFLSHYQLWLHPPLIVDSKLKNQPASLLPGGVTYMTYEQMQGLVNAHRP